MTAYEHKRVRTFFLFELDGRRDLCLSSLLEWLDLETKLEAGLPGARDVEDVGAVLALDACSSTALLADEAGLLPALGRHCRDALDPLHSHRVRELDLVVPHGAHEVNEVLELGLLEAVESGDGRLESLSELVWVARQAWSRAHHAARVGVMELLVSSKSTGIAAPVVTVACAFDAIAS